jgi:hypothetical protein
VRVSLSKFERRAHWPRMGQPWLGSIVLGE